MTNILLALLLEKDVLTLEETKYIVDALEGGVLPSDFKQSHILIKNILSDFREEQEEKAAREENVKKVLANKKNL